MLFGESSPHQLARPRVLYVDNQRSDGSLVNPVPCAGVRWAPPRVVRVISPAIGVAQAAIPKRNAVRKRTGVHGGLGLEDSSRRHIDVGMCVVLSETSRLELCGDGCVGSFGHERAVVCGLIGCAVANRAVLDGER